MENSFVAPKPLSALTDHDGQLPLVAAPADGRAVVVELRERHELPIDGGRLAIFYSYRRTQADTPVVHCMVTDRLFAPLHYAMDPFLYAQATAARGGHGSVTLAPIDPATLAEAMTARAAASAEELEERWIETTETREWITPEGRLRLVTIFDRHDPETYVAYQLIGDGTGIEIDGEETDILVRFAGAVAA